MLRTLALPFAIAALSACGDTSAAPLDAATDAPPAPRIDGGPLDAGPITITDPGTCDTWGLDDPGAPITGLVDSEWTWVDFPEALCMDGSATGIGISQGTDPRMLIFLEGGGVCLNGLTCVGVANPNGFDGETFGRISDQLDNYGVFDRADTDNPFATWTLVYVPYCTGDTHAGTTLDGYEGRDQVGYTNVHHFLTRLVPTFPSLEMVVLAGSSAGGLGAMANYDQVVQAFGCTPTHLLDDSGPILEDDYLKTCLQRQAVEIFDIPIPADCPQCDPRNPGGQMEALWDYLAMKYPDRRMAQLSYTGDSTMRQFYSIGYSRACNFISDMSEEEFEAGLLDLRAHVEGYAGTGTFYVRGTRHTFLTSDLGGSSAGGQTIGAWIGSMLAGDASWDHVGP